MRFILTGFTQDLGFRVFSFEQVAADRVRKTFTVRADLALSRQYGIRIQELPLLCLDVLERSEQNPEMLSVTFTEDAMRTCAVERAAAKESAAQRPKAARRNLTVNVGAAWRGHRI